MELGLLMIWRRRGREYHFYDVSAKKHLNIWARTKSKHTRNPNYSHDYARTKIRPLIQSSEYLIAFEPPNNDRYGLLELFGQAFYASEIAPKVICLKKELIDKLFTTNQSNDNSSIYLRGLTQRDIYDNLLTVGSGSYSTPDYFLPIIKSSGQPDDKCEKDVRQLTNMYLLVLSFNCVTYSAIKTSIPVPFNLY